MNHTKQMEAVHVCSFILRMNHLYKKWALLLAILILASGVEKNKMFWDVHCGVNEQSLTAAWRKAVLWKAVRMI